MTRIRKQHYVPQFYLEKFGTPIHCFDKIDKRTFSTNTKQIAFETDFYGIAVEGDDSIEKVFSAMDYKFSVGYHQYLGKLDFNKMSFEHTANFLAFITTQYLRTRRHRNFSVSRVQDMFDQIALSLGVTDYRIEINAFGKIGIHLSSIQNWPAYSSIVSQMNFTLLNNQTEQTFWTSDNPVVITNDFPQLPFSNGGIICRGIQLHFPLTPKKLLIISDPSLYGSNNQYSIDVKDEKIINFENLLQVNSANRHIFSKTNQFDLAIQVIENKLKLTNIASPLPKPDYTRTDITKPDYWPDPNLLKEIWSLMNK